MQPGISRATIGGIMGFLALALVIVLIRAIFGIGESVWQPGLALTFGAFGAAYGVIWGIGGFNPAMSAHPDDSVEPPTLDEMAENNPTGVLSSTVWQVTFWSIIIMVVCIAIAVLPGFGLNVTTDATASSKALGTYTYNIFGDEVQINQAFLLLGFILFTALSLAIAGGAIAAVTVLLNRGVVNANAVEKTGSGLPSGLERRAGNVAGQLAEFIAPKNEDKETTAVVAQEEQ